MDVNLFGPYKASKTLAPLIIESRGRITTTGSISGILSNQMLSPYSMSKHAVEAYTNTLAVKMEQFGVAVSVIEPENYNPNILDSLKKRHRENGLSVDDSRYRDATNARSSDRSNFKELDEVSAVVYNFLKNTQNGAAW
jgi:NAD(P)-dependent dehydrogenase (short-subunit alcohol dehydrogenase family)